MTAQQSLSNKIEFHILTQFDPVGTASNKMFARNNAFYTISKGKLVENHFTAFGNKMVHRVKEVKTVSTTSAKCTRVCDPRLARKDVSHFAIQTW